MKTKHGKLPTEVYFVDRVPAEGERIPYYGKTMKRLYERFSYVQQFIDSNKKSKFKVYKIKNVEWVELQMEIEVR